MNGYLKKYKIMESIKFDKEKSKEYLLYLFIIGLLVFPLVIRNTYIIHIASDAGLYTLLALGLSLTLGVAGLLNLGYIAFFAIGAYTYACLNTKLGFSFFQSLPICIAASMIFAFFISVPVIRVRGDYLAIVTLGFSEIIRITLNNFESLTNGPRGIDNIAPPQIFTFRLNSPVWYYYLIVIITLISWKLLSNIKQSPLGKILIAIREDEIASAHVGINTHCFKILTFLISALFAAIGGAYFASRQRFITPESFTFMESILLVSIVILGGLEKFWAITLAAIIFTFLPEMLRTFAMYRMLLFGLAMVILMIIKEKGRQTLIS